MLLQMHHLASTLKQRCSSDYVYAASFVMRFVLCLLQTSKLFLIHRARDLTERLLQKTKTHTCLASGFANANQSLLCSTFTRKTDPNRKMRLVKFCVYIRCSLDTLWQLTNRRTSNILSWI